MKMIALYIKYQWKLLGLGLLLLIFPYLLICLYLPKIPYMHFLFLSLIFLIRILALNEGQTKKRLKPYIQRELAKQLRRSPSNDEIFKRIQFYIRTYDITLLLLGISIIFLSIIYQQF
jgi:hypothetical protein